jgi:hypothetical protein
MSLLRILCLRALFWAAFKLLAAGERALGLSPLTSMKDNSP